VLTNLGVADRQLRPQCNFAFVVGNGFVVEDAEHELLLLTLSKALAFSQLRHGQQLLNAESSETHGDRDRYATKDKGKPPLTGPAARRPNKAGK
jgi:hypothetical protein